MKSAKRGSVVLGVSHGSRRGFGNDGSGSLWHATSSPARPWHRRQGGFLGRNRHEDSGLHAVSAVDPPRLAYHALVPPFVLPLKSPLMSSCVDLPESLPPRFWPSHCGDLRRSLEPPLAVRGFGVHPRWTSTSTSPAPWLRRGNRCSGSARGGRTAPGSSRPICSRLVVLGGPRPPGIDEFLLRVAPGSMLPCRGCWLPTTASPWQAFRPGSMDSRETSTAEVVNVGFDRRPRLLSIGDDFFSVVGHPDKGKVAPTAPLRRTRTPREAPRKATRRHPPDLVSR